MTAARPPRPAGPDIDALAEGLARRLRDVLLAERRLERFAFAPETAPGTDPRRLAALVDDDAALGGLARDLTLRAFAAAADAVNFRLLACLGAEPLEWEPMARALGLPVPAVSERANALAQVGLAARDLERDGLAETAAGRRMVALVEAVSAGVAERCRAEIRPLL